jgi:hypothetical protein
LSYYLKEELHFVHHLLKHSTHQPNPLFQRSLSPPGLGKTKPDQGRKFVFQLSLSSGVPDMSTVRLLVRAADGNWSGIVPSRLASRTIATLSADPTSFEELRVAVRRFVGYPAGSEPLAELVPGDWDTPHDRGIVVLDLVARMVAANAGFGQLSRKGGSCCL